MIPEKWVIICSWDIKYIIPGMRLSFVLDTSVIDNILDMRNIEILIKDIAWDMNNQIHLWF